MTMPERVYSVLLVSSSESLNAALSELLPVSVFTSETASDVSAAKRAFAQRAYDIVIVNSPLPDDPGIRFAIDAGNGGETVSLLLLRSETYEDVTARVSTYGVFTLRKPLSKTLVQTALSWLIAARERLRKTEKRTQTLEEKMEEIRLVNRAKWLMIDRHGMDEPTAHRYIEKLAMDRCVTRRVIAEEIINKENS